MIGLSRSSPRGVQHLHEKQQENIEGYRYKLDYVEDANQIERKKSYKPVTVIKQARMFAKHFCREYVFLNVYFIIDVLKEHDNDGQIHPVETDELT